MLRVALRLPRAPPLPPQGLRGWLRSRRTPGLRGLASPLPRVPLLLLLLLMRWLLPRRNTANLRGVGLLLLLLTGLLLLLLLLLLPLPLLRRMCSAGLSLRLGAPDVVLSHLQARMAWQKWGVLCERTACCPGWHPRRARHVVPAACHTDEPC
jgi:hypothetical protein